jgi:hypothetical protein
MAEPLQTYLHDHYSGSTFAAELLETLQKQYPGDELGRLAGDILVEVKDDREVLHKVIQQIGSAGPDLKDVGAWVAEKVSRLKLKHDHPRGLGAFEALETLSLGILGKRSLWAALKRVLEIDSRVRGIDYDALIVKADDQFARIEQQRLQTARSAFARA